MRYRADIEVLEKHDCTITIDWQDEICIEGYEDTMWLGKDEAIAAARAILKHFNATLESDQ